MITHPIPTILCPKCNFSDIKMNEPMGDLRSQIMGTNTQSDGAVFKTVLFYSVLILLLPIGSFFVTKSLIFEGLLAQVNYCENKLNIILCNLLAHKECITLKLNT